MKLTESQLKALIKESVKNLIREYEEEDDISYLIDDICEDFGEGPVVIEGVLGLWDGQHQITPTNETNIYSALQRCLNECEIFSQEDLYIDEQGIVHLNAHHHDGTNVFTIKHSDTELAESKKKDPMKQWFKDADDVCKVKDTMNYITKGGKCPVKRKETTKLSESQLKAWELKHYWDDGCTIECRYFPKWVDAKKFAEQEGYTNYKIVPTDENNFGKKKATKNVLKETELDYDMDNFSGRFSRGTRYNILVDGDEYYSDVPEETVDRLYDDLCRKGYENVQIVEI